MNEYYTFRCNETFLAKLKVERPIYGSTRGLGLVGSAKGLLFILNIEGFDSDLYLWNPSLGKIKCLLLDANLNSIKKLLDLPSFRISVITKLSEFWAAL